MSGSITCAESGNGVSNYNLTPSESGEMNVTDDVKSDESSSFQMVKCLDGVEKRVEMLREQAMAFEREKESLLVLLQDLQDNSSVRNFPQDEREDIELNTERLICRLLTIEVSVSTPRNEFQEKAYQTVKGHLERLNHSLTQMPDQAGQQVQSCLNACLPEPSGNHIDLRFQGQLLECTVDDQKRVRKQLETMLDRLKKIQEDTEDGCR